MSYQDFADDQETSFLQRNRIAIVVGVVLLGLVGTVAALMMKYGKVPPPHKPEMIVIHLQPPPPMPPPPPPPPPPPQPPEQKFVEQPKDLKPENKPKDEPKLAAPPGPPGPKGTAADDGTLQPGGGGGESIGGSGGSEYGPYAAEVIATIRARLEANSKTNKANFHGLKTRIWADSTGRVIKATVSGTTGDPSVDEAIKNEVLAGLQLQSPPPQDMPMPIVMLINEQRPN